MEISASDSDRRSPWERALRRAWAILHGVSRTLVRPVYWLYEKRLDRLVAAARMPQHLGLILDGNRRFARTMNMDVRMGHQYGVRKVREVLQWCVDSGIPHVTIFVFSAENFQRAPEEVKYLLDLFAQRGRELLVPGIAVRIIGRRDNFPDSVIETVRALEAANTERPTLQLNIALAYGGREEIVDAVRSLLADAAEQGRSLETIMQELSASQISQHLYTAGLPDPDFIIRTSGELRLSGFCLWQSAYSEYYFCEALWPAFRRIDFLRAIRNYQNRQRRFGR